MDDIWSTKAWDDIKMAFPDDRIGSRIILTTRLSYVAAYPDSSIPLHEMHFMDEDQSWNLLKQKVFAGENCPPELETTGKVIARSCRGLPLAIVLIAGLLSAVTENQASWMAIVENINLAISITNDEQFTKILSFSYNHLPHHLRPCLLYMGGFPKDYEIRISKLIKLWVAECFIKPGGSKSFEEEAEGYLEDLVKRSLVLVTRRKFNGKIKFCSFHDLERDLCIRKVEEEKFFLNVMGRYGSMNSLKSINYQRRIAIASYYLGYLENTDIGSTIRTITCFYGNQFPLSSFGKFRLLRVLDAAPDTVQCLIITKFSGVLELFHLRYLAFKCIDLFVLSPFILNIHDLQTLIVHRYGELYLPMEIWRMQQLRHLIFKGALPNIPEGAPTFPLENLQTLSGVKDFKCTEEILKMIPNLKTLGIYYPIEGDEYAEDYHLNNLVYLHKLEKLKLEVHTYGPFERKLNPVFPRTLKNLTLRGLRIPWKDMGIVGLLSNLEVLKLRRYACYGDKWETSEGEFPRLKFLLMELVDVQQWVTESSHFPNLKWLKLYTCWNLIEIPDAIGEILTLELIEVNEYNESVVESARSIKEEQKSCGNDSLQVRFMAY